MKQILIVLAIWPLLACVLVACGTETPILTDCSPADGVTPICGFENPEDLAPFSGGSWIVVSQFPGPDGGAGSLVAFRPADGRKETLFPDPEVPQSERPMWGSPDCPGPPDPKHFGPHGIDGEFLLQARKLNRVDVLRLCPTCVHGNSERSCNWFETRACSQCCGETLKYYSDCLHLQHRNI